MSDVTSLELLLDEATEAAVRAEWEALAAAGLSSMAAHTSASNRPHVTLLARTSEVPHPLDLDAALGAARLPLPLTLGAPVLFGAGDRRVLARSVVPSAALLALHAALRDAAGPGDDADHMAPGRWTPHVTLARRLRLASAPEALALVGGDDIEGEAVALRRWDAATTTITHLAP